VNGGDRRHEGEPETETVVAGAVIEACEWQEQPVDLVGWHDRAGVGARTSDVSLSVVVQIAMVPSAML
jgi:hypothetical protein